MTVVRVRLCEADRERFGAPDELVLDVEALKDLDSDGLEALDKAFGSAVAVLFEPVESWPLEITQVRRAAVWLALRMNGLDVEWADTGSMKPYRAEITREARPPAGPSERSSEDAPPSDSSEA